MSDEDGKRASRRKLAAKRFNENVKLVATSFNAVALTTFAASLILPSVAGTAVESRWVWIVVAVGLHTVAHIALKFLRSED